MPLRLIMIGDIVGKPGRRVVTQQIPYLQDRYQPDLIIANAENAASGSGLTPSLYKEIKRAGVHGMTLGDHVYRKKEVNNVLTDATDLIRPANLSPKAVGPGWMKLPIPGTDKHLYVITVLGRIFMPALPANDPFETLDNFLESVDDPDAVILAEIHAEATGEKIAFAHHLDGRVAAVIGTHTHVPTADAQILKGGTAYITDIGMTGPYESILGRRIDRVVYHMTTSMPAPFDVAYNDVRLCGVFVEIDDDGKAITCERIEVKADPTSPPFVAEP